MGASVPPTRNVLIASLAALKSRSGFHFGTPLPSVSLTWVGLVAGPGSHSAVHHHAVHALASWLSQCPEVSPEVQGSWFPLRATLCCGCGSIGGRPPPLSLWKDRLRDCVLVLRPSLGQQDPSSPQGQSAQ